MAPLLQNIYPPEVLQLSKPSYVIANYNSNRSCEQDYLALIEHRVNGVFTKTEKYNPNYFQRETHLVKGTENILWSDADVGEGEEGREICIHLFIYYFTQARRNEFKIGAASQG